ncbi:Alpha-1,4 glucan phosphorylase [Quillaja saponaria]|uniref:Alpha-1,4 glucan phosphorylase n=1 Tax=Quillaja saponaria TaxID=32244 RepID=A0AAD7KNZ9_QUISA|nr:Alpha-1,4 glucan phosphorylase [Quillaja saponaria]
MVRTSSLQLSRKKLYVNNVASNQKQNVKDSIIEEGSTLDTFIPDSETIASSIKYHVEFTPSFSPEKFELPKAFFATAESVRDTLIINWNATYDYYEKMNVKQAYYMSMEFLQGRALLNAIGNLELSGPYAEALRKLGHNLEDVANQEPDAALGNGGLGRLASCFLDSLATLNYPAWGYGLRYKYGLFKQHITKDGQEEVAESWLEMGNPWEVVRNDVSYPLKFHGEVIAGPNGSKQWVGGENITSVAYDVPIPGYKTKTTINLRLWFTKVASEELDLLAFNTGEHAKAYAALKNAEKICYVLYPGDESIEGKTLRLKQQYTLCSASIQDIIARFERRSGETVKWDKLPEKLEGSLGYYSKNCGIHKPHCLAWALEKWSLKLMQELLPRHVEIIQRIDEELIHIIIAEYGTKDLDLLQLKLKKMRILENIELPDSVVELLINSKENSAVYPNKLVEDEKVNPALEEDQTEMEEAENKTKVTFEIDPELPMMVRMANLSVVGGHSVNGVAEIHSEIVKEEVFNEFYKLWPEKFQNKTNGVTPRRWIRFCNPDLCKILTKWIGTEDWVTDLKKFAILSKFADTEDLKLEWKEAKRRNKIKVASFLKEKTGYLVSPDAMFDVQVKRIHEYKRQLMNIMGIVYRYKRMKEMNPEERLGSFVPRVCIFGGKAFATYVQAKRIVKFITDVGTTVNHDPEIGDLLKVVFVPHYNVSIAEVLIPGSELTQHISTAGMEASGTSNMKFAMNGSHEIAVLRKERAEGKFVPDSRFEEVKAFVRSGVFGPYNYEELIGSLEGNEGYGRADNFLVGKDFPSYIECQEKVDEAYRDQKMDKNVNLEFSWFTQVQQ